ncbi:hypothetical protein PP707_00630 [Acetobacter pasteurianus]|nr:hypothetical protein [Acetobacter pasteurianus]
MLRQGTINGTIIVKYVQTQLVIVDAWTKPLGKIQFSHLIKLAGFMSL